MENREHVPPKGVDASEVQIKICGITNPIDAEGCAAAGAHLLGFNFYKGSRRYIEPEAARRIVGSLPETVKPIGVFVNAKPEEVLAVVTEARLDGVQLHGDETPGDCLRLRSALPPSCELIKAVRVRGELQPADVRKFGTSAILLDAWAAESYGGTGMTLDWDAARAAGEFIPRLFLAGGLTPRNVEEAVRTVRPFGVDVCSGVESAPGRKSLEDVRRFIASVRQATAKEEERSCK